MHKLWVMGALTVLVGCDPVVDNRPPVVDAPGDAGGDAPVDAPADAPPPIDYDIAYVNEFTFTNNIAAISSFLVVVNRSTVDLNLAMTDVVMFSDDNAAVSWTFAELGTSPALIPPGRAAGELSPLATQRIIDSGLVPEPRVAGANFNFSMQFANVPANTTFNLNGQATIAIQDERLTLPFTIHFVPGSNTVFNNASRIMTP
jgi:hypothetical protein